MSKATSGGEMAIGIFKKSWIPKISASRIEIIAN